MILFDNALSSNALKVRFLLTELGIDHERREVSLDRPRPDWYVALNPLGGIPAIDDDGFVLAESNTILRYLALREGRDDLLPTALVARARLDEFLDRWTATIRPAFYSVERPALGLGGHDLDLNVARARVGALTETLELLSGLVSGGDTVLETLTLADFAVAPVLFRTRKTPIDLNPFPKLVRLREALTSRPSFIAAGPVR
jgi:glutathione S-transferase